MTSDDAEGPEPREPSWLERLGRKRWARWLVVLPTLALLVLGLYVLYVFNEDEPVVYAKIEDHFKYGSTGGERESGFPYWIFQALPQVCALHLPGPGWASLGFTFEEGKDLPVGMSRRRYQGIDRTFLNCAVCHASTVRDSADAKPRVYLGMPAHTFNVWGFQKFLFDCAKDPRSAASYMVPEIDRLLRAKGAKVWHRLLGAPGGRCPSLADYVRGPAATRGAIAAGGGLVLPSLPEGLVLPSPSSSRSTLADRGEIRSDSHIPTSIPTGFSER